MSLLNTLRMVELLSKGPLRKDELAMTLRQTERTIGRYIELATELGVMIESVRRADRTYALQLMNLAELEKTGRWRKWLELEQDKAAGLRLVK